MYKRKRLNFVHDRPKYKKRYWQPEGGNNDGVVGVTLLSTVKLSGKYDLGSQPEQMFTMVSSNMIIK